MHLVLGLTVHVTVRLTTLASSHAHDRAPVVPPPGVRELRIKVICCSSQRWRRPCMFVAIQTIVFEIEIRRIPIGRVAPGMDGRSRLLKKNCVRRRLQEEKHPVEDGAHAQ